MLSGVASPPSGTLPFAEGFELPPPVAGAGPLGVRLVGDRGPVVVLIHGLGRVAATWAGVAAQTCSHLRLVLPDNPGFGRSSSLAVPRTIHRHAELHLETLDSLHLPPPYHVAGLSLGGMIAPALAALLGDRCASVTLFSSSSKETGFWRLSPASILRQVARVLRNLSIDHRANIAELVRPELLAAHPELPLIVGEIQRREGFRPINGVRQLWPAARWRIRPVLGKLPAHRVVAVGSKDRLVSPIHSARLAALLGVPLQVLEGHGHDLGLDAPQEVARILMELE
jgi:pimeloyl-ACP methyl ester carboxylesterase